MNKHSILLVDDDILILNTLKKRFETWQIEVFVASEPEAAKQVLAKLTPEVVMLDLLLTREDGSSGVIDYMKSQERLQQVPILVLTNLDKPELKEMLMQQGIKEYIIKGTVTLDDLYDKVMSYLEPAK